MAGVTFDVVRTRIAEAAARAGRPADAVTPIAVTAGLLPEEIAGVLDAGIRDFGASSVDDLVDHAGALGADVRWHFVGRLRPDTARRARNTIGLLHTLDTPALLDAWIKGPGVAPPVLVLVAPTPGADGVQPDQVPSLVEHARLVGVDVSGLAMTDVPAPDASTTRRWFGDLRRLRDRLRATPGDLPELAMGTSGDYEVAIEEGSTLIRLGATIFGSRR